MPVESPIHGDNHFSKLDRYISLKLNEQKLTSDVLFVTNPLTIVASILLLVEIKDIEIAMRSMKLQIDDRL